MKVEKKTGAFYIIGYLLELIIKYGDWKKYILINLVNLGSKYGNFLHIFLKNPPLYTLHQILFLVAMVQKSCIIICTIIEYPTILWWKKSNPKEK